MVVEIFGGCDDFFFFFLRGCTCVSTGKCMQLGLNIRWKSVDGSGNFLAAVVGNFLKILHPCVCSSQIFMIKYS